MMRLLLLLLLGNQLSAEVTIRTVRSAGGDYPATLAGLQAATNYCLALNTTDPCVVDVEAGLALTGAGCHLTITAHTAGHKLLVLRSSRLSELPSGVRVFDTDAAKLGKVENNCGSSPGVIIIPPETTGVIGTPVPSHVLIQGMDLYYSGSGRNAAGALNIGIATDGATKARQRWQWPNAIFVDRSWMHGLLTQTWVAGGTTTANQNGAVLNGRDIVLANSRLSDNNMDSVTHGNGESHGISSDNGTAFRVYNNHIDGSIGSLTGGGWTWIPGLLIADTYWEQNYYTRDPWAWHWEEWDTTDTLDLAQPCVNNAYWQQKVSPFNRYVCTAGLWTPTATTRPNRGWTKNANECKNCLGFYARGNFVYQIPSTNDQSQQGFSFLVNNVDAQDFAYFARPQQVRIEYNYANRIGAGPTLSWGGSPLLYRHTNDVRIRHNLHTKLGGDLVSPTQGASFTTGGGNQLQWSGVDSTLVYADNTTLYDRSFGGTGLRGGDSTPIVKNVILENNMLGWGVLGQTPLDMTNEACSAFRTVLEGATDWDYFGLVDTNSRGSGAFTSLYGQPACPVNVSRVATYADVRFVNFNAGENGDYRLCTAPGVPDAACAAASPWAASNSRGGPLGADVEQVMYATNGVPAGTPDAAWREFRIRLASASEVRYTAYAAGVSCTGEIRDALTDALVDSWTDAGGLERDRTHTPAALSPGLYLAAVTCSGRRLDAEMRVY